MIAPTIRNTPCKQKYGRAQRPSPAIIDLHFQTLKFKADIFGEGLPFVKLVTQGFCAVTVT